MMTPARPILLLVVPLMGPLRGVRASEALSAEAPGGVVLKSAQELVLTFNQTVEPLVLQLTDPYGGLVDLFLLARRYSSLIFAPPEVFAEGTYVLGWRAIPTMAIWSPARYSRGTFAGPPAYRIGGDGLRRPSGPGRTQHARSRHRHRDNGP
jgi:methionine-rich copper-binding protein CopC